MLRRMIRHAIGVRRFNLPQIAGLSLSHDRLILISPRVHFGRNLTLSQDKPVLKLIAAVNKFASSERVICKEIQPGRSLELTYAKKPAKRFCDFIESTPKTEIVAFFREVAEELEDSRQLEDFHLKIRDVNANFRIYVFYGEEKSGPEPSAPGGCISCFADAPLYPGKEPGMEARECVLEEFCDRPHMMCRLDAKGRSGFVVTPVRHVMAMSDLEDDELFALWSVAVNALRHANLPFVSMILNHGSYRNIAHLHLKVWVEKELFEVYQMTWSEERKERWRRLQELAMTRPRKQQVCMFFKRYNWCWHGDMCSYLHIQEH